MGTPQKLSSEWARKKGFDLTAWDFHAQVLGTTPDVPQKKHFQAKRVECLDRGSCENGECWQEAVVLLLSGTLGGLIWRQSSIPSGNHILMKKMEFYS